ncbi:hypothetical protein ACFY5D_19550 [Paeniglutamicibacter sp. NPDC012692]
MPTDEMGAVGIVIPTAPILREFDKNPEIPHFPQPPQVPKSQNSGE